MTQILQFPRRESRPCDVEYPHIGAHVPRNLPPPSWWQRLSTAQKWDLVLGIVICGILFAALLMVPGN